MTVCVQALHTTCNSHNTAFTPKTMSTLVQDAAESLGVSLPLLQEGLSIGKQATISLLPPTLFVFRVHAEAYSHVPRSLSFCPATCAIVRVGPHSIYIY